MKVSVKSQAGPKDKEALEALDRHRILLKGKQEKFCQCCVTLEVMMFLKNHTKVQGELGD